MTPLNSSYGAFRAARCALMLSSSHKPGCMAAMPASQSCRVRRVLWTSAAHFSCVQPARARSSFRASGEGFDKSTNVCLQLSAASHARCRRVMRRRVSGVRHGVFSVFGADAFGRVDHRTFAALGQREASLNVVNFDTSGSIDCDGHDAPRSVETGSGQFGVSAPLGCRVVQGVCFVNCGLERLKCFVTSLGVHAQGCKAAFLGFVCGVGRVACCQKRLDFAHDACSFWNASYRLDSGGNLFAAMTELYARNPCLSNLFNRDKPYVTFSQDHPLHAV